MSLFDGMEMGDEKHEKKKLAEAIKKCKLDGFEIKLWELQRLFRHDSLAVSSILNTMKYYRHVKRVKKEQKHKRKKFRFNTDLFIKLRKKLRLKK